MKAKSFALIIVVSMIFLSCKKEPTAETTASNVFHTRENSANHLKLEVTSTDSWLVHNETLNFTRDSIFVALRIVGMKEGAGTGDVHLYSGMTTFAAYYFYRDTLLMDTLKTDTLIYRAPDRATITFRNFTGNMNYQMDGF